jgi:hypothetical protein
MTRKTVPVLAVALVASAATLSGSQQPSSGGRLVVAEYMRAVPAGPTDPHHCARVCVKARDMGGKAEPVCVEWKRVC